MRAVQTATDAKLYLDQVLAKRGILKAWSG